MTSDFPRHRYEKLRSTYSDAGEITQNAYAANFINFGFFGLFAFTSDYPVYISEHYYSPFVHWCGKMDPGMECLRDAYMLIVSRKIH